MSISQTTWLTKPEGDNKVSAGTLAYISARIRQRAYDLVIREFKKSGLTQAQLCRRWGKAPEAVSRFLARPANWELNTFTEALFAISGAVPTFSLDYAAGDTTAEIPQTTTTRQTHSDLPVHSDLGLMLA